MSPAEPMESLSGRDVLVTGASGFLGGSLALALAEQGARVRILARASSRLAHLERARVEVTIGDLLDEAQLAKAARGCDAVFHCAALASDWGAEREFWRTNVDGVAALLSALSAQMRAPRLVHVSTTDVFGYPRRPEASPEVTRAVGLPYNESKLAGERLVWDAVKRGMPITIARPATIYGPRSESIAGAILRELRDGRFAYVAGGSSNAGVLYIDDATRGLMACATREAAIGRAYTLVGAEDVSWRSFVEALADEAGYPRPRLSIPAWAAYGAGWLSELSTPTARAKRPLITRHAVLLMTRDQGYSIAAARRDLAFNPSITLGEGVRETVAWWRALEV